MKSNKNLPDDEGRIISSFQSLKQTLMDEKFADRLNKTLAYWALPNDRRLPLAFLDRTIKDLLTTPFEELSATPGIGEKKIYSLVRLLTRATKDDPPIVPLGMGDSTENKRTSAADRSRRNGGKFDPTIVSEALWSQWQETVKQHGVGREKLGRLAPTLQALPTVIWHAPIEFYADLTVAQIRGLKTHGEKRVRAILEVFYIVHELLSHADCDNHLTVRMRPKFIEPIERWISDALERPGLPSTEEVRDNLTLPLLNQIKIDAGATIYEIAKGRLGIDGSPMSVRQHAKQMGVTRARIYQLLEDCGAVMNVRWPEGQELLERLAAKCKAEAWCDAEVALLLATIEMFYPEKKPAVDDDHTAAVP